MNAKGTPADPVYIDPEEYKQLVAYRGGGPMGAIPGGSVTAEKGGRFTMALVPAALTAPPSRAMFVARLENKGEEALWTTREVLGLLNDCDMLAAHQPPPSRHGEYCLCPVCLTPERVRQSIADDAREAALAAKPVGAVQSTDEQIDEIACRYGTMGSEGAWIFREGALREFVDEVTSASQEEKK